VESGMRRGRRGAGLPWVVVGCVRASEPSPSTTSSPSATGLPLPRARLGTLDPPPHVRLACHTTSVYRRFQTVNQDFRSIYCDFLPIFEKVPKF
jgi:hypothetical protein